MTRIREEEEEELGSSCCRCFPGFSLVLDPRGRLEGMGGKVGNSCAEFEVNKGGILG